MKKLLLLLTVLFLSINSNSQVFWAAQPTGFATASRGITDISYSINSPNVIWTLAYDGPTPANNIQEFGLSLDGGLTWTSGNVNVGDSALGIATISAINATTAVVSVFTQAGGPGGGIWKTVNSGVSWQKQTTAAYSSSTSFTNVATFFNENDGFTMGDPVGGFFEIYTTSNGGALWNRTPNSASIAELTGEFGTVRNIYHLGNTVWFGTNKGRFFRSIDKGLTWTNGVSPLADTNTGEYAFKDNNNGILTDDGFNQWTTVDGGITWTAVVPNGTVRDGAICYVSGSLNAYVCLGVDGDVGTRGSSYSCDGGANWTDINLLGDDVSVNNPSAIAFYNQTNGLASGFNATVQNGIFKYVGTQIAACDVVSTSQFSSNIFSISPNPTTGVVNLKGSNINQVAVTDILGKVVLNNSYSSLSEVTLNMSDLNSGVYFVKVTNNEGTTSTSKVVKQ